jgi:hypothetical protein
MASRLASTPSGWPKQSGQQVGVVCERLAEPRAVRLRDLHAPLCVSSPAAPSYSRVSTPSASSEPR